MRGWQCGCSDEACPATPCASATSPAGRWWPLLGDRLRAPSPTAGLWFNRRLPAAGWPGVEFLSFPACTERLGVQWGCTALKAAWEEHGFRAALLELIWLRTWYLVLRFLSSNRFFLPPFLFFNEQSPRVRNIKSSVFMWKTVFG